MIQITNLSIYGFPEAIRGMRNPFNSWEKADSIVCTAKDTGRCDRFTCNCNKLKNTEFKCHDGEFYFCFGRNDMRLAKTLALAGTDHGKFLRFIVVYATVEAPFYWWKEMDTYRFMEKNSCSTMHTVMDHPLTLGDFECDGMDDVSIDCLGIEIKFLNNLRQLYINEKNAEQKKTYWNSFIKLLPSNYVQRRDVMLNYMTLRNMYHARKDHRLKEWHDFCHWVESLPYAKQLITIESRGPYGKKEDS